ncbi:winged helix-turn-helix transcriptional regulator [Leucobacter tenebrionis]|uniref:winged helix-turn-helix transcriptional regulator n=1 Tax=Leucobacter tenebrionis TaxID=2873270 RepID=UPI001CA6FB60|nr:helix-turn-helix domain-containing protein [Leucobacter tenebrionis]QZY50878.1 helix-turn-helix transcriptional regulator [Leucobacter tenebrionis]
MEPISAAADVLGDRWTLLILRDIVFEDRRYFRALLTGSAEGIATNILADRLARLLDAGILTRGAAGRGQRARYSLTEAGVQTVPVLLAFADWGRDWRPTDTEAETERRLPVDELMRDLRARHAPDAETS